MPEISVLMPVYNGERYVKDAIDSLLNQTFIDFEIIVVNDGSTDKSKEIILSFNDAKIKYYENASNKGLIFTRNLSVELAKGKYVAFLDSDDIALSERLQKQYDFLEKNPQFGLVSSFVQQIDEKGNICGKPAKMKVETEYVPVILLFRNCFVASTVMVRKNVLPLPWYREGFPVAEDYDLWKRILTKSKAYTIPETLSLYRKHSENISVDKFLLMKEIEKNILKDNLLYLGLDYTLEEFEFYFIFSKIFIYEGCEQKFNSFDIIYATKNLQKLIDANDKSKVVDRVILINHLTYFWRFLFTGMKKYNMSLFKCICKSDFYSKLTFKEKLKFSLKCFIAFKNNKK